MTPRSHSYPGIPHELRRFAKKKLSANGFSYHAPAFRGALFVNPDTAQAVLLDHRICDTRYPFAYTLYTKEQNALMHKYRGVFRFMADTRDDLADAAHTLDRLLHNDCFEDDIHSAGRHRQWHDIDPTLPEASFEQAFIDCYGRQALEHVIREFPVIDINGHTRWVDYYIRRHSFDLAIEKNGETWHHPLVIGWKRYQDQLTKQNSLVAYGTKVFRWSLEGMKSTDNFLDEMRLFFGNPDDFLSARKLTLTRPFSLFEHQATVLEDIQAERAGCKSAFLVVLPTGTGKTEILIAEYVRVTDRPDRIQYKIFLSKAALTRNRRTQQQNQLSLFTSRSSNISNLKNWVLDNIFHPKAIIFFVCSNL